MTSQLPSSSVTTVTLGTIYTFSLTSLMLLNWAYHL